MNQQQFRGKICDSMSNKVLCNFNIDAPKVDMKDKLMFNFKNILFSSAEKRFLTSTIREKLYSYQHINEKEIMIHAEKLINQINSSTSNNLHIEASEVGAYICLAAAYSGKINKDKIVTFTLSSFPVMIFPKHLSKTCNKNTFITMTLSEKCWLKPFTTLNTPPKHLNIEIKTDDADDQFYYQAA